MSLEKGISAVFRNSMDFKGCLASLVILLLNMWFLRSPWIGLTFFAVYAVFISRAISRKLGFFEKNLALPFSFLFLNMLFAIMSAVAIGLRVPLTDELLVLFLLSPMLFFLRRKSEKTCEQEKIDRKENSLNPVLLLVFSVSIIGVLWTLWGARTGSTIPYFQENLNLIFYIFNFVASISVVIAILSKCGLRSKLIIVSIYLIASHLFRYVIYVVIWGSDMWDNLITAWWIRGGGVLQPHSSLYYYLAAGENAYLGLWGINVSISRVTGIDLYTLYPYIGLLLSFFVPLILYKIVKSLVNNETYALLVSLMCSFLWEAFIWLSLSSANGLGILGMLFSLLFWILYLKNEKMSIFLPLLMTLAGVLTHPLTGIYVALIAILSVSIKRTGYRKKVVAIGFLSCLVIPLYDVITRMATFLMSGVFPVPDFLPVDALLNNLIFLSQRSGVNNLLDIPYLIIYFLVGIGIILGRGQVKREIYSMLLVLLISALFGEAYGQWVQVRVLHRIGSTILPLLYLIFSSMSFKWVYTQVKGITPSFRVSLQRLRRDYSVKPRTLFAVGLCITIGVASTSNFLFSPAIGSYNASTDDVNAVNHIISQDPSRGSLILTDVYTIKLLSAFSHGSWYNYPYGNCLDALSLTVPTFSQVLSDPSNVRSAIQEGQRMITNTLAKLNVTNDMNKFYLVYDAVLVPYLYSSISSDIVGTLSSILGEPKVFGNIFVYSGRLPESTGYGWITQLDEKTIVYDMAFTDFKSLLSESIIEGRIIYDPNWNGLLAFTQNSSLTIRIDAKHKITNASLSCSLYQYDEYDGNFIQASVDGLNWITVWTANTTGSYIDLDNLKLPSALNGNSSFYLRFHSEKANADSGYSMAIRTLWDNASNGIKLRIFTGV